jgi:Secretion system C-terminal sorting domain
MSMRFTISLFFVLCAFVAKADVNFFADAVIINGATQASTTNIGAFAPNAVILNGGTASSWQNNNDDVCDVFMDYSVSGGGPSGTITLNYLSAGPGGGDKNWSNSSPTVNISNLPNGTYTLTLNYRIFGRWGGVGCFSSSNPFNTAVLTTIAITFTVNSALPVTLTRFEAKSTNQGNELAWNTEVESSLSHFEVERSLDGKVWKQIGKVEPRTQNSIETQRYQFLDASATDAVQYYRLRIVDLDATAAYSGIVVLRAKQSSAVTISPNPASDYLTITAEALAQVTIVNQLGQVVLQSKTDGARIDIAQLQNGIYQVILQLEDGRILQGQKFMKI